MGSRSGGKDWSRGGTPVDGAHDQDVKPFGTEGHINGPAARSIGTTFVLRWLKLSASRSELGRRDWKRLHTGIAAQELAADAASHLCDVSYHHTLTSKPTGQLPSALVLTVSDGVVGVASPVGVQT